MRTAGSFFLAGLLLSLGCHADPDPAAESQTFIEPVKADQPDAIAVEKFRQATAAKQTSLPATDWPQLFGPQRTSAVPTTPTNPTWGKDGPELLWSAEVGTGYGSPVVASGRVVFNHRVGDEEIVACVDASSGAKLWEHRYRTTFHCEMEYSDGPYSTPLIAGGDVYVVGGQGQMFCLDLETGQVNWDRDLHAEYGLEDDIFPVGSAPIAVDDRLIFNVGAANREAGVIAIDRSSGETLWEATDHDAAYCSPFAATIHGEPFVFVFTQRGLVSLHPTTGKIDWEIEHRGRAPMSYNSVSPLVHQDRVLVVTGPGPGALCVQVQPDRSYKTRWEDRRVIDSQYNTLMLAGDHIYGFTAAGQGGAELRCVDMRTGELKWKYASVLRRGQGLIAGGAMIILGERGHLASLLVSSQSPQVLAFTAGPLMKADCYCAPAYAAGRLYLKDQQRVACFKLE